MAHTSVRFSLSWLLQRHFQQHLRQCLALSVHAERIGEYAADDQVDRVQIGQLVSQ